MKIADQHERASLAVIRAGLVSAGTFEVLTLLATQDKTAWAASPWRRDPYHTMVSLAAFTVPVLSLAILVRLLAWRAPGGPDRVGQTVRATGVVTALAGLTLACEWAAVFVEAGTRAWSGWTTVLLGGLILCSILAGGVAFLLYRERRKGHVAGPLRNDWLADAVFVCRWIPLLRRWAGPAMTMWIRRHAMAVFFMMSLAAGIALTGSQAVGERWTDPLLIGWMLIVETTANFTFCLLTNGLLGFIARPYRTQAVRIAEISLVLGSLAVLAAAGFHDALWRLFGHGTLNSVPALVVLTLGPGLATALAAAAISAVLMRGASLSEDS